MGRKMNKLIISALLIFGLVGMIGTAAAGSVNPSLSVIDDPIIINIGETNTQTATLTLTGDATNQNITKIKILNVPTGISTSIDGNLGTELTDKWGNSKTWTISYTNVNAVNGKYVVTYEAHYEFDGVDSSIETREATIQTGINAIPEFPTIALPVAAVLGLMFIISSRKKKE
ncbi:MAG: PEF-CTERM sorting domain-containing protein [Methanosarcinales archaeon]|nr:PEF-CTERM sorting domain-containing protein [Methanosarcinales archaeon]